MEKNERKFSLKDKFRQKISVLKQSTKSLSPADKAKLIGQKFLSLIALIALIILLVGLSYIILYPLLFITSLAFRDPIDMTDKTIILLNKHWTFDNIIGVFNGVEYWDKLWTTICTAVVPTIFQLISCAVAGYGFARFKFKGKGILFGILVFSIIVPVQTIATPLFMNYAQFDLFGLLRLFNSVGDFRGYFDLTASYLSFYLPALFAFGIRGSLFVFIYRQFFSGFPKELEEAAYIDGCGPFETFIKILIPNAVPAFMTVGLFSLVWYYNDFYNTSMFMPGKKTLAMVIENLKGYFPQHINSNFAIFTPYTNAMLFLFIMPLLIIYLFAQRKFIEGVERSGIVG